MPRPKGSRPLKVVLSGYYGFGNLGDEAVLAGILSALRELAPEAEPLVLSARPGWTEQAHGVRARGRGLLSAWRALNGAAALVSGGGGLLQDRTSRLSPLYYLAILELARLRGVPVLWFAQGLGPLRSPWLQRLTARAARRAELVVVRDEVSRESLVAMGADPQRLRVGADAAWLLAPWLRAAPGGPDGRDGPGTHLSGGPPSGPSSGPWRLVVAWRDWPGQPVAAAAAGRALGLALADLARRTGRRAALEVLALHPSADLPAARALARAAVDAVRREAGAGVELLGVRAWTGISEWPALVQRAHAVVSVRLHGLILAVSLGKSFGTVAYDPKVTVLMHELGCRQEQVLDPAEVGRPQAWLRVLEHLMEAPADEAGDAAGRLQARARQTAALLVRTLHRVAAPSGRVYVLGLPVDRLSLPEAAGRAAGWLRPGGSMRRVVTLNPEMVMEALRQRELARAVAQADLVVADGVGIAWAALLAGRPLPGRVPGIELAEHLLQACARLQLPVFLVGGGPGVAARAAGRLSLRMPGLSVAGVRSGYFLPGSPQEAQTLAAIEAARPALLLVGMGSPRQELWLWQHRARLAPCAGVAMGVGGSLDVWAGRVRRAPAAARRLGLEWLYRLVMQPRRARRMAVLPVFAVRAGFEALQVRLGRPARRTACGVAGVGEAAGAPAGTGCPAGRVDGRRESSL